MSGFYIGAVYTCVKEVTNIITNGKEYMVYGTPKEPYIVDDEGNDNYIVTAHYGEYFDLKEGSTIQTKLSFSDQIVLVLDPLKDLLISKNEKYGNSALDPVRIFSKANATEQLLVRVDDKISRIKTQSITEDEDVLEDLLGYLVLLKITMMNTPKEKR